MNFSHLIGLSIILIFYSCQSKSVNQIDTNSASVTEKKSNQSKSDSLTVQDRLLEDGNIPSHIQLDFALTKLKISDTAQIQLINKACAVSVIPDTNWINKQQKEMGDDWNEVVSDNQYYEQQAVDTLEKLGIPTYFAPRQKRFINFIKSDSSSFMIDLTKMKDAWGLILFNGNDIPVLWNNTEIDNELKEIYKK